MSHITIILPLDHTLRDTLARGLFCKETLDTLYAEIIEHNKKITIEINKDAAAIHLLNSFTLEECVKNALDAGATQLTLTLSIAIENNEETVAITLSDNGKGTQTPLQEYDYRQAFLSRSEKRRTDEMAAAASPMLGGKGKGLAMSAQYIHLFARGSALLTGKSPGSENGFTVLMTSTNELATAEWIAYQENFDTAFWRTARLTRDDSYSPLSPDCPPTQALEQAERKLLRAVLQPTVAASPVSSYSSSSIFSVSSPLRRGLPPRGLALQVPANNDSDSDDMSTQTNQSNST